MQLLISITVFISLIYSSVAYSGERWTFIKTEWMQLHTPTRFSSNGFLFNNDTGAFFRCRALASQTKTPAIDMSGTCDSADQVVSQLVANPNVETYLGGIHENYQNESMEFQTYWQLNPENGALQFCNVGLNSPPRISCVLVHK